MAELTTFEEAPASINFKVKSPKQFELQITLRHSSMHKLQTNFELLETVLLSKGYQPLPHMASYPKGSNKAPIDPGSPLYCKIHHAMMKESDKGFPPSHIRKLLDGNWDGCNGSGWRSEQFHAA